MAPAIIIPISDPNCPDMLRSISVAVKFFSPCRKVDVIRNSFHAFSPTITLTVRRPGDTTGAITYHKTCPVLAPSILAASSSSLGTFKKNVRIRNSASGIFLAARIKLIGTTVPTSFK